ncbi:MAG: hypothetical protein JW724_03130 [Candidatus Altiarchaeota archaeon]|nr:hypothetical protein [Candidatus Altiarchaeota archaeon]
MRRYSDYGGGDMSNPYCVYCTDQAGKLKPRDDVREGMMRFMLKQGICRTEAERKADEAMNEAPAWKKK